MVFSQAQVNEYSLLSQSELGPPTLHFKARNRSTPAWSAVEQGNFDGYQVLRISDAPYVIEVHIVPSAADSTGMGESAVPPLAPAVAIAIVAATGKQVRRLPIDLASHA